MPFESATGLTMDQIIEHAHLGLEFSATLLFDLDDLVRHDLLWFIEEASQQMFEISGLILDNFEYVHTERVVYTDPLTIRVNGFLPVHCLDPLLYSEWKAANLASGPQNPDCIDWGQSRPDHLVFLPSQGHITRGGL